MDESIRNWIPGLLKNQPRVVEAFIAHVQPQLLRLARTLIRGVPNRESDEEDLVNAALHSFLWRAADRQFELHDEDDLWKVVQTIVSRKASNHRRRQQRRRDHALAPAWLDATPDTTEPLQALIQREVVEHLMSALDDDELRTIARMKFERHTNVEIASATGRSLATIERRLKLIRSQLFTAMNRHGELDCDETLPQEDSVQ